MTKLTYLHEAGVLYNLQRRYALNDIYVSASSHSFFFFLGIVYGEVCVSVIAVSIFVFILLGVLY